MHSRQLNKLKKQRGNLEGGFKITYAISYGRGKLRLVFGKRFRTKALAQKELRQIKRGLRSAMFPNARVIKVR